MDTLSTCNKTRFLWLDSFGDIFETNPRREVIQIYNILNQEYNQNIVYKKENCFLYYKYAFELGFIKIKIIEDILNIQLTKPAKTRQKTILLDLYNTFDGETYIEYNFYESNVYKTEDLLYYLNGLKSHKNELCACA